MSENKNPPEISGLLTLEEASHLRKKLDAADQRLVFTNGCFDILHAGHVRYLQQARKLGDVLLVALNSDTSVQSLKGPSRPVNPELSRAEVLLALRAVDYIVIFSEPRATKLLRNIRPHAYAKGGDYTVETLNSEERQALESIGAEIHLLGVVPGHSTTGILEKLRNS